ncbi:MAG: TRAP transporter small permease [Proteobacteria bacterium]|nr:TRAP transporter small permease [Pseudomonadota bacterium]
MSAPLSDSNRVLKALDNAAFRLETFLVTACLGAMIIIVLIQIFMRNAFDSGFLVGDSLVKHLVLWVTFLGAGLASKNKSHIKINIADSLLPDKAKPVINTIVDLFSAAICGILAYASYSFVVMEFESGSTFGITEIPVWILEAIIPLGFGIIALRFVFDAARCVVHMMKPT